MNYFVFEDTVNETQVKIYQETCSHVKNEPIETTKWHEFENFRNENDMRWKMKREFTEDDKALAVIYTNSITDHLDKLTYI